MTALKKIQEELAVAKAQLGETGAFEALVRLYHPRLYYYVRKLLDKKDLADDVMQEVWTAVHRKLPRLRARQAFGVWVYRIAYAATINTIRAESRYVELPEGPPALSADEPDNGHYENDIRLLNFALDRIARPLREVIMLRFMDDLA